MNGAIIIERIKQGDKKPLEDVYKAFRTEFINWATAHYTCTREEARDIYQAAIITLYDNIQNQKLEQLNGSIKTYLFAIGKYKILELRRADKKMNIQSGVEEIELADIEDWETEKKENDLRRVEQALLKLGEPCKTMLELYYLHEMSLEELANHMNYKNSDTTKNLKSRCLARLRKLVEEGTHSIEGAHTINF